MEEENTTTSQIKKNKPNKLLQLISNCCYYFTAIILSFISYNFIIGVTSGYIYELYNINVDSMFLIKVLFILTVLFLATFISLTLIYDIMLIFKILKWILYIIVYIGLVLSSFFVKDNNDVIESESDEDNAKE